MGRLINGTVRARLPATSTLELASVGKGSRICIAPSSFYTRCDSHAYCDASPP